MLSAAIYIIGICVSINDSITHYEYKYLSYKGSYGSQSYYTNATPRDMWKALVWPFRAVHFIFWGFLEALHDLTQYPLLIVGVEYKDTNLERKISSFLSKKWLGK